MAWFERLFGSGRTQERRVEPSLPKGTGSHSFQDVLNAATVNKDIKTYLRTIAGYALKGKTVLESIPDLTSSQLSNLIIECKWVLAGEVNIADVDLPDQSVFKTIGIAYDPRDQIIAGLNDIYLRAQELTKTPPAPAPQPQPVAAAAPQAQVAAPAAGVAQAQPVASPTSSTPAIPSKKSKEEADRKPTLLGNLVGKLQNLMQKKPEKAKPVAQPTLSTPAAMAPATPTVQAQPAASVAQSQPAAATAPQVQAAATPAAGVQAQPAASVAQSQPAAATAPQVQAAATPAAGVQAQPAASVAQSQPAAATAPQVQAAATPAAGVQAQPAASVAQSQPAAATAPQVQAAATPAAGVQAQPAASVAQSQPAAATAPQVQAAATPAAGVQAQQAASAPAQQPPVMDANSACELIGDLSGWDKYLQANPAQYELAHTYVGSAPIVNGLAQLASLTDKPGMKGLFENASGLVRKIENVIETLRQVATAPEACVQAMKEGVEELQRVDAQIQKLKTDFEVHARGLSAAMTVAKEGKRNDGARLPEATDRLDAVQEQAMVGMQGIQKQLSGLLEKEKRLASLVVSAVEMYQPLCLEYKAKLRKDYQVNPQLLSAAQSITPPAAMPQIMATTNQPQVVGAGVGGVQNVAHTSASSTPVVTTVDELIQKAKSCCALTPIELKSASRLLRYIDTLAPTLNCEALTEDMGAIKQMISDIQEAFEKRGQGVIKNVTPAPSVGSKPPVSYSHWGIHDPAELEA